MTGIRHPLIAALLVLLVGCFALWWLYKPNDGLDLALSKEASKEAKEQLSLQNHAAVSKMRPFKIPIAPLEEGNGSNKPVNRQILSVDPHSLRDLAPLETSGLSKTDQAQADARSARAKTLNARLRKTLVKLRQRRAQASGSERARLDKAIAQFERNLALRSSLESSTELPRRTQ